MGTEYFKKAWFKKEAEANHFAQLVSGDVYDADFIGGCIVQYQSNSLLKRYVFEEYRDEKKVGSEKIFTDPDEAVNFAKNEWRHLSTSDKKSYLSDPVHCFHVYEMEITGADLGEYLEGTPNFNLSERYTNRLWAGFDDFNEKMQEQKPAMQENVPSDNQHEFSPEILSLAQRVDDFMFNIAAPYDYLNEIGDASEEEFRAANVRFLADSFRRGDTSDVYSVITEVRNMMETENTDNTDEIENANQILTNLAALEKTQNEFSPYGAKSKITKAQKKIMDAELE